MTNHIDHLPDPATPSMLLPAALVERDNARRMRHYKTALRQGLRRCLTPVQREQIRLHYDMGMRKTDIARRQGCTCSAVSKSIKAGREALQDYIELYMEIYSALEREFLRDIW